MRAVAQGRAATPPAPLRDRTAAAGWGLAAVFLVGAGGVASRRSLWTDEGDTWATSATSNRYFLDALRDWDSHAPLYFAAVRGASVLGDSELVLRLVSVLACAGAIVVVQRLARRLFDDATGLVAAGLTATSAFVLDSAAEARNYGLTVLLMAGSTLALLRALADGRRRAWLLYGLLAGGLALSHVLAVTGIAAQATLVLVALWRARRWPTFAEWAGAAVVGVAVAVVGLLSISSVSASGWLPPEPGPRAVGALLRDLFGAQHLLPLLVVGAAAGWGALRAAVAVRGGPPGGPGTRRRADSLELDPATVLLVLAVVPLLVVVVVSFARSLLLDRYAASAVPGLLLAAAHGLRSLPAGWSRRVATGAAIAAGLVAQVAAVQRGSSEDFRSAIEYVEAHAVAADSIAYVDAFGAWTGAYYLRDAAADATPAPLLPQWYFPAPLALGEEGPPIADVAAALEEAPGAVWVVVRVTETGDLPDEFRPVLDALLDADFAEVEATEFTGLVVQRYERAEP